VKRWPTLALVLAGAGTAGAAVPADMAQKNAALLDTYCSKCHNDADFAGEVAFEHMDPASVEKDAKTWEAAVRKLRGRMMPPPGSKQPPQAEIDAFVGSMEASLDALAIAKPAPGHVGLRRLNRTEYGRAIEDLLGLRIDPSALLPKDVEADGFDTVASALKVSPSFLDQYLGAAREISRQALGDAHGPSLTRSYRGPGDEQAFHRDGLPLGTRGGMLVEHEFPADGEYVFNVRLTIADQRRGVNAGYISGLDHAHRVIVTLDGKRIFEQQLGGPEELKAADLDQQAVLKALAVRFSNIRVKLPAGPHRVGVAFVARTFAESDNPLTPLVADSGTERMPRVANLDIVGPFNATGVADTPSRERIFVCRPATVAEEEPCATRIITQLARKAYRRPVALADVAGPLAFYRESRREGGFESGIEAALTAVLASPRFLFRAEPLPDGAKPGDVFAIGDVELASRLSFFLWSQGPDDELLRLAEKGELSQPARLEQQVKRMLADDRSKALVTNFASQWLRLPKIDSIETDPALFPGVDRALRADFKEETLLFVDSILRSDRNVLDLLTADYTFVNERLARHYGLQDVRGDQFRRVALKESVRFGLLGKGSTLLGTSYGNRTSTVLRGAWILENLTGTPPHAPPPGVETLKENVVGGQALTVRERMERHRADPSCNACHGVMDPLGFALENFDATGKWRTRDRETLTPIDASSRMSDGTVLKGPDDLRALLLRRPEQFVQTLTEKLMVYGLGRSLGYRDMPVVRQIVRDASRNHYAFSSMVLGLVSSPPFRMTQVPVDEPPVVSQTSARTP
jgi:hypothetical protein